MDIRTVVGNELDIKNILNEKFKNYKGQFIYSQKEGTLYVVNAVTNGRISTLTYDDQNNIDLINSSLQQVILTNNSGVIPENFIPTLPYAEITHKHYLSDIEDYKLYLIVDELPTEDIMENTLYLIPKSDEEDTNYKVYLYIKEKNKFQLVCTDSIDYGEQFDYEKLLAEAKKYTDKVIEELTTWEIYTEEQKVTD